MTPTELETFDAQAIRYLSLKMTPQQADEFKATVESNPELKERLSVLALIKKAVIMRRREKSQEIADAIRSLSEEEYMRIIGATPKKKTNIWPKFIRYAAAACVVGLICLIAIPMLTSHPYVDLGNSYDYSLYDTTIDYDTARGDQIYSDTQLQEIATLFGNIESGTDLDKSLRALHAYYDSITDQTSYMADFIAWNLAIGYLKSDKPEQARKALNDMVERNKALDPEIAATAQALIDKIDEAGK